LRTDFSKSTIGIFEHEKFVLFQAQRVSCACLPIGWLTDRAMHRTPQNRRGCTISDIQTRWFKKCLWGWRRRQRWYYPSSHRL